MLLRQLNHAQSWPAGLARCAAQRCSNSCMSQTARGNIVQRVSSNNSSSSSTRHWRCCRSTSSCSSSSSGHGSSSGYDEDSGSSSIRSDGGSSPALFYNRTNELKLLGHMCARRPDSIIVVLGPRSAGKTAFLQQYMQTYMQQAPSAGGGNLVNTRCYIDGRSDSISSPSALAIVLLEKGLPQFVHLVPEQFLRAMPLLSQNLVAFAARLRNAMANLKLQGNVKTGSIDVSVSAPLPEAPAASSLTAVLKAYIDVLGAWDQARAAGQLSASSEWPVLVIDEANVLMAWSGQYATELQELLRFFVNITKASRRCHVMLATSEYAFQTWLTKGIGPTFWQSRVIGDFTEPHAKEFLNCQLAEINQGCVSKPNWINIYKVCGGNAGAIIQAANSFAELQDWPPALAQVVKDVWTTMMPGYLPAPGAGYTAADYATAVDAILKSDSRAVHDARLATVLGTQPLEAMVQANLLALRRYSRWAEDIDAAAFGPDQRFTVVTAPTPLHLYQMERKRSALTAPLGLEAQQVPLTGNTDHGAGPSRPPSPTSVALEAVAIEIATVQGQITEVEQQIQDVSQKVDESMTVESESRQVQLAVWQQEKQRQLVEEKRQVREKERQLQEKQLLLMKRRN